jgi:hypothetical protein
MESYTIALRHWGNASPVHWVAGVDTGDQVFTGCGDTEEAAVIVAMEKAARENNEARMELGVLLGQRGDGKGGRPSGTDQGPASKPQT